MTKKFKIFISYPPLESTKGSAFLSQNRQFQWTNTGNVIFPVIPAYGATLLAKNNYDVIWDDAIAKHQNYQDWYQNIIDSKPDLIFIETKTPVVKKHWQIINQLKNENSKLKICLMGDHVTALPQESLQNSQVDYVITGGDYDFMMLNLANHLTKKEKLQPGFWFRKKTRPTSDKLKSDDLTNSGPFALKHHNLDDLPIIDRDLTQWQLYSKDNTNYKYTPGAYIMSGRDCWWGKCTFCSWVTLYPHGTFRSHSPKFIIKEIENLVNNYHVKEIFDDAGTLPIGPWLKEFCQLMIDSGLNKKVTLGCNMRFGALNQDQYHLLKKAGFRFILYGMESSNQATLDKIQKNTKPDDAKSTLVMAKKAGLEPHLTIMIGYPWESKQDALTTLNQAKQFFIDGLADSLQATRIIPYPGSALFDQCKKEGWLLTQDWNDYDMRTPIMKSPLSYQEQQEIIQGVFKGVLTPKFLISRILSIRSFQDIRHYFRYAIKFIKKLNDFSLLKSPSVVK